MTPRQALVLRMLRHPLKASRYVLRLLDSALGLSARARVGERGERVVIRDWSSAKGCGDFAVLAHLQRYEWVSDYVKGLRCLDAGCGSGYGTHFLREHGAGEITGVDISRESIAYARKHYRLSGLDYRPMDVCGLDFEDDSFHAVICFHVLEHLDEAGQEKSLGELTRVLQPEGAAFIACPNAAVSRGTNPHHFRELSLTDFDGLLHEFFQDVRIFGQDLSMDGERQKGRWRNYFFGLSPGDFVIVEEQCEQAFGLLAVCGEPIKPPAEDGTGSAREGRPL